MYFFRPTYTILYRHSYQSHLIILPEITYAPAELKDDFINFQEITKIAYKNKEFDDFSFYHPIAKVANFVDVQSEKNFEIMLRQFYIQ